MPEPKRQYRKLSHGMLLDAKSVMDDALPDLEAIRELIPEKLHGEFERLVARFKETLCECDVSDRYLEKQP
jgi:hypothetical protein